MKKLIDLFFDRLYSFIELYWLLLNSKYKAVTVSYCVILCAGDSKMIDPELWKVKEEIFVCTSNKTNNYHREILSARARYNAVYTTGLKQPTIYRQYRPSNIVQVHNTHVH